LYDVAIDCAVESRYTSTTIRSPSAAVTDVDVPEMLSAVSAVPASPGEVGRLRIVPTSVPVDGRHTPTRIVGWKFDWVDDSANAPLYVTVCAPMVCAAIGALTKRRRAPCSDAVLAGVAYTTEVCDAPIVPSMTKLDRDWLADVLLMDVALDGSVPPTVDPVAWP
jgi:hypothetical protein